MELSARHVASFQPATDAAEEDVMSKRMAVVLVAGLAVSVCGAIGCATKVARQHITEPRPPGAASLPFSDGVLVGDTLYLSGKIGLDPKTGKVPATVDEEARLVMDRVKSTLQRAGMTMDDLVYVQVFCSDLALYGAFNAVYRTYFSAFPARAFIGSGPLLFDSHFEVQGIAVKR
jgi:2-iminobutanoate/2-iminopropanoate deaminase